MRIDIGGGVRLFFDVEGCRLVPDGARMRERPTVLLVGGPGADHSAFKPTFGQLADVAQVIYMDLRGSGRSDRCEPASWRLAVWAEDLHRFCERLGIERPIVLGHSAGGAIALTYAIGFPNHPAKLILSSPSASWRPDRSLAVFKRLGGQAAFDAAQRAYTESSPASLADFMRLCLPLYTRTPLDPVAFSRALWNAEVGQHFSTGELRTLNLLPELGKIRCPTLVIAGEDDPVTTLEDCIDVAGAIGKSARLERVANAGHGVYVDAPEHFFAQVRRFISAS